MLYSGRYRRFVLGCFIGGVFLLAPLGANALLLEKPIDCQPGVDCFIQNYVDAEPGPGYADPFCGPLSYNRHKGVDFRVSFARMQEGVEVRAAAPGVVRGVRDGMADISIRQGETAAIRHRECGNGVLIAHPDGMETQYCHMRKGSIRVKAGEKVNAGQPLGLVGLSGDTEFPHLHFEVRIHGKPVSPFTGKVMESGCAKSGLKPLWSAQALRALPYVTTGGLDAGFTAHRPDINTVFVGGKGKETISSQSPQLLFWAGFWGVRKGDTITMRIDTPTGEVWTVPEKVFSSNKAQVLVTIGKKRTIPWPPGVYKGRAALIRQGEHGRKSIVIPMGRNITIPPTSADSPRP